MTLEYQGEEQIPVDRDAVWAFVTDPEKVAGCMPDVIEVAVQDATHFTAVVRVAVGPVRGKFTMKVEMVPDPSVPRIGLKISGGGFGSAMDLTAGADLVEAGAHQTTLKWTGQAVARGPVAAVGGRVLDAQAQKLIGQAFANVRQQLSA